MKIIAWLTDYIPHLFGLVIGTVAYWGTKISAHEPLSRSDVIGHIMQLGMILLLSVASVRLFDIQDRELIALQAAILALSAQEVIRFAKRVGWRKILDIIFPANGGEKK